MGTEYSLYKQNSRVKAKQEPAQRDFRIPDWETGAMKETSFLDLLQMKDCNNKYISTPKGHLSLYRSLWLSDGQDAAAGLQRGVQVASAVLGRESRFAAQT